MTKYKVKVFYQTGNSFETYDTERVLEMEWTDKSAAKEALRRIEEHYRWYTSNRRYGNRRDNHGLEEPDWHKDISEDYIIKLSLDNGAEVQFPAFGVGYFEHLYMAEIFVEEDGFSFTV